MDFVTPMTSKLINENTSMQLSTLITKVRKAKTAAEERAIIKQESAYIRTVVGSEHLRYAKRNLVKLMYIRMLGYPAEFGQVPCLDLITKGDYSAKRVGYLGLMLLLDETHETLMMVTNSLKTDLNRFGDPYILLNALTALANICSSGMAADLAPEVERLCDAKFLARQGLAGPLAGHVRKKALLVAVRMVTRAPDTAELFRDIPGAVIPDGNHAVVMGGVTLIQTIIAADDSGKMLRHYRTATAAAGPAAQGYPALLTAVLSKLHHSKSNYEYTVSGICNPYLQVKVLKVLALLGKGSQEATDAMADILAKVAAAHTTAQAKAGRVARTTAGAVAMEAVGTIMAVQPVPRLRSYAVQIMANFLKLSDNNMRYVALNTLLRSAATDLGAVQRHRTMIVECVKDPDSSIRKRALDLVYALVNDSNVAALSAELLAYLEVTDEAFKPSLAEHLCLLTQKFSPSTRWYVDQLLTIFATAGAYTTENVAHAFVVRVSNAEPAMHAYTARQALRHARAHLSTASDLLLRLCAWAIGEYGDLLEASQGLLEGEEAADVEGGDLQAAAVALLQQLMQPQHASVHAVVVMAATKLLGRLPAAHGDALRGIVRGARQAADVEVQQRSCEVAQVLQLKSALPAELIERIPPLDEATYAGNLQSDVATLTAAAAAASPTAGAGDLLGDLLGDSSAPAAAGGATGAAAGAAAAPRSVLDDLDDLLGGTAPAATDGGAAAAAGGGGPLPFVAWRDPRDGIEITFECAPAATAPPSAGGAPATDITATYTNGGAAEITGLRVLAAVPKGMTVEMKPAEGGDTLAPAGGSSVTQRMVAVNSTGGLKSLAMRLKVIYTVGGEAREHLGVVNNFPAGL